MKSNINKNSKEIIEVKKYFNEIVPPNYIIRIQFKSSSKFDLFVYEPIGDSTTRERIFGQWNVNINNYKETSQADNVEKSQGKTKSLELVLEQLNWNRQTFKNLYEKLDEADCIGICNRKPVKIEYGYSGMSLLSYLVFDDNLTEAQKVKYSDNCKHMFYKENIVLHYGSGTLGSLCNSEFNME